MFEGGWTMNGRKRKFAMAGGLCGVIYLLGRMEARPGVVEFLLGLVLGIGIVCLVLALLPEETLEKLRKWKRRGE